MSSQFPRRRWAESGDWDSVRPLITRMYKVEGRPLKEVMRIMEAEHQFLATPKMYKKRIKDWAIDKNVKSERHPDSPRTKQQRDLPGESRSSSARSPAVGAHSLRPSRSAGNSSPDLIQTFQYYGTRPSSAEGTMQRGHHHHTPGTTLPLAQHGQHWVVGASQTNGEGSYNNYPPSPQGRQAGEQARTPSALLHSIRDRLLEASDAITRHDTAVLFEILNPAYEAISSVPGPETPQLLAVVADLFSALSGRPNHQDMLRQLLDYVFALVPDAGRRNPFLSTDNSQVLAFLGRSGCASTATTTTTSGVPLDTAGGFTSGSTTVPFFNYGYYEQSSGAGPTSGSRS